MFPLWDTPQSTRGWLITEVKCKIPDQSDFPSLLDNHLRGTNPFQPKQDRFHRFGWG